MTADGSFLTISSKQAIHGEAKKAGQGGEQHIIKITSCRPQSDNPEQPRKDRRETAERSNRRSG
jgi:hypothetical protein